LKSFHNDNDYEITIFLLISRPLQLKWNVV